MGKKFKYKENSYFKEDKEYTFKNHLGIFKSKVVKGRNNIYYTMSDGVNTNENGIYKASSILTVVHKVKATIK